MQLLTEPEAAEWLRMGERTLRKLRRSGAIRYVALTARKIAYRAEDCEEYVQAQIKRAEPCEPSKPPPKGKLNTGRRGNVVVPFSRLV